MASATNRLELDLVVDQQPDDTWACWLVASTTGSHHGATRARIGQTYGDRDVALDAAMAIIVQRLANAPDGTLERDD